MTRRQFIKGDRVRYTYSDGSFDDGTVTGKKRNDGHYPVRFDDKAHLFGVQLVMPSVLRLIQNNSKGG